MPPGDGLVNPRHILCLFAVLRAEYSHGLDATVLGLDDLDGHPGDAHRQAGFGYVLEMLEHQAVEGFRPVHRQVQSELAIEGAQGRYQTAGDALVTYAGVLDTVQSDTASALASARTAKSDESSAEYWADRYDEMAPELAHGLRFSWAVVR